ncbi:carboxypeptidase regulatory-like domain-containing protein, partial [Micromonospora zhanjiangensis]
MPAAPAHAAATGSITGRLTTSTGAPAADAWVSIVDSESWNYVGNATTDATGGYTVANLAAGSYLISFQAPDNPEQYYHQRSRISDADPVTVAAGKATRVDEQLRPTGVITGQITDAAGAPVPDLSITGRGVETMELSWALTDDQGRYRMPVIPGRYHVELQPIRDSYQTQYVPGTLDETAATAFEVGAGQEVTADDRVLPTGHLAGRFTTATGQPAANVDVDVFTPRWGTGAWARTDAAGNFDVTLLVGSYKMNFSAGERLQYYRQKLTFEEADTVTVEAGRTTSINESWLPTGSVRVKAVDSGTGAAVANFCVSDTCSKGTGVATVTGLAQGRHEIYVYAPNGDYFSADQTVDVVGNQTVEVTVKLRPAARISTTVVDRATGRAVANVCVVPYRAGAPTYRADGYGDCTDAAGKVTIGLLEAGSYQLYADPRRESGYGLQWVGATGGTGDQRQAVTVTAGLRTLTAGPAIKLDKAGAITGRVTDAGTNAPLVGANVNLLTVHPGVGAGDGAETDSTGRYRFDGLGPYEWPLVFDAHGYPAMWSGGATNRYDATRVKVTAGGTASQDAALRVGTEVTGAVKDKSGTPFGSGYILAHNSVTGDIVGSCWMDDGHYSLRALAGQSVYLTYDVFDANDRQYSGQWPAAPSMRGGVASDPGATGAAGPRGAVSPAP